MNHAEREIKGSYMGSNVVMLLLASVLFVGSAQAQVTPQPSQAPLPLPRPAKKAARTPRAQSTTDVKVAAPQVVTILHRLSGLKLLGWMIRDDRDFKAIAQLDEAFKLMSDVHTNVIAGLALDDGKTVVAWLPEVEAEMPPPWTLFAPKAWSVPDIATPTLPAPTTPAPDPLPFKEATAQTPDLTVIASGGKRFLAHYVGLDAASGLSILKLDEKSPLPILNMKGVDVIVGQRLRLFAPEPAVASTFGGRISVRVGETDGTIIGVTHAPSGRIYRLKIKAARLSPANIGGIAVNESGETVGIVDRIDRFEASIVPASQIRKAARRVLTRQSSVPRPWLGVSGEPVASVDPQRLKVNGWKDFQAAALTQERSGIFLTAVVPNSPAAEAELRPGDVILSVNGEHVRNAEDFSWFLEDAGPGGEVNFTVMHPGQNNTEAVSLKLSDAMDSAFFPKNVAMTRRAFSRDSLPEWGIEAVTLRPPVAARFGGNGGLLVVFVQPGSEASKAGLQPGDLIESITKAAAKTTKESVSLKVVRAKQRLTFLLERAQQ
jgi:S1-C subfamily serine protease